MEAIKRFLLEEIKTIITGYVENNDMERTPREDWHKRGGQCYFQRKIYNLQCFHLPRHNEGQFFKLGIQIKMVERKIEKEERVKIKAEFIKWEKRRKQD